jgi:hypothetical protein
MLNKIFMEVAKSAYQMEVYAFSNKQVAKKQHIHMIVQALRNS